MSERPRRRDAVVNRERILEAAVAVFAERGYAVPVAELAEAAGVGVGTFYRSFPDRSALLVELGVRAWSALDAMLDRIDGEGLTGLAAVRAFLLGSREIGDRLVLPLHGAPPVHSPEASAGRQRIHERVGAHVEQARADGAFADDVTTEDVILCGALVARPTRSGPFWDQALRRHVELFLAGLAPGCGA